MAAIKRSQANQRRQPENFHLYQQQQQSSVSMVKVELQNLIISILDDPVVSRVFGEAGFRSCDIKLAILRPIHQLLRYKRPPMFLCNLGGDLDLGFRGFSFPFLGFNGYFSDGDENCRRIGEVLLSKKGRNPMLVGVCALEALRNFLDMLQRRRGGSVFPVELSGLSVICIEDMVLKFTGENFNEGMMKLRFDEVGRMVEQSIGPGVIISFGDLRLMVGEGDSIDAVSCVVRELSRLMELHGKRLWLIGATAVYDTYLKFVNGFPSIENDWDLQLLPITSPKSSMGETYPRSSFMESFVPFGGFFSTPSDMKSPLSSLNQSASRCHLCNGKCEQEVTNLSRGGFTASVADQYQSSLPSWLQMAELDSNGGSDVVKANGSLVLSAKVASVQKKWDNICQRLHRAPLLPKADAYCLSSRAPAVVGFKVVEDAMGTVSNHSINKTNASSNVSGCELLTADRSLDLDHNSTSKESNPLDVISKSMNLKTSKLEDEPVALGSSPCSLSSSSVGDSRTSPTSVNSVTTDLGLGIRLSTKNRELEKSSTKTHRVLLPDFSGCLSPKIDAVTSNTKNHTPKSPAYSCSAFLGQCNQKDFKMLYTSVTRKIGRQEEAVTAICQTIACCETRNEKRRRAIRGDIWFDFCGPDRVSKKKVAVALAEVLYGGNFIYADLFFEDGNIHTNSMYNRQEVNEYDMKFRGKTLVDYIAHELSKKPLSVVYLENVDKGDPQVQSSLLHALRSGRFLDSHGREVSISKAVFVTTSRCTEGNKIFSSAKGTSKYSEENVVSARGRPIQMLIGFDLGENVISHNSRVLDITTKGDLNPIFMNKRKLISSNDTTGPHKSLELAKRAHRASNMSLDLNLPAEESEISSHAENPESEMISESSKAWLEDYLAQVDETVVFKPFDFDALAEKKLKEITQLFHKFVGSEGSIEIDLKVMEQILAAVYLSDNSKVDDWVEQVLVKAFVEVQKRYNLSSRSIVKLVTCEGLLSEEEEQKTGLFLPARIIMN